MNKKRKTVFITGVSGFVGKALAEELSEDFIVLGLSRQKDKFTTLQGDLGSLQTIDLNSVDIVVHLATAHNEEELKKPGETFLVNVGGMETLLRAAKKANVKRFIFASSGGVFERGKSITIDSPRVTSNEYFRTKELARDILMRETGIDVCIAYLFFPYGPNQKEPRLIPRLIKRIKNNESITTTENGGPEFSFTYIDDLVEQLKRLCLSSEIEKEVIITGKSVKMKEIIDLIGNFVDRKPVIEHVENGGDLVAEDTVHKITEYTPKIDIKEGLKRTIFPN